MTPKNSHAECGHAATPKARAACRKARINLTDAARRNDAAGMDRPARYGDEDNQALVQAVIAAQRVNSCDYCGGLNRTHVGTFCPAYNPGQTIRRGQAQVDAMMAGMTPRERREFQRLLDGEPVV